jgi:hypothetical protein
MPKAGAKNEEPTKYRRANDISSADARIGLTRMLRMGLGSGTDLVMGGDVSK